MQEPDLICLRLSNKREVEIYLSQAAVAEGAFICQEILVDNEYLRHGIELTKGATVIDVGANIGVFGIQALTTVPGGDITYIALEPCPPNFRALQLNLLGEDGQGTSADSFFHLNPDYAGPVAAGAAADGNRVCPAYPANIRLVAKAASSASGTLPLTSYPRMPGNSTLRPAEKHRLQAATMPQLLQQQVQLTVPVITLDQLLEDEQVPAGPIDLLKVDVEGEELAVLQGLSRANWAQVRQVVAEVHDCLLDECDDALGTSTAAAAAPDAAAAAASSEAAGPQQLPQLAPHTAGSSSSAGRPGLPQLPGPRGSGIDGRWIRLVTAAGGGSGDDGGNGPCDRQDSRVSQPQSTAAAAAASPAAGHLSSAGGRGLPAPAPRDGGRVMAVAQMLQGLGFLVVIDCPLGIPTNYMIYGRRPAAL